MTRTALTAAAALALVGILAALCLAPRPAVSFTPTAWTPVRPSAFLPIDPLVRPVRMPDSQLHSDALPVTIPPRTVVPVTSQRPTEPPRRTIAPKPTRSPRTYFGPSVSGIATWQPLPGLFASAGPKLRAAGVRVGQTVRVCANPRLTMTKLAVRCVAVTIWPGGCWCPDRKGVPVLLDLSFAAFSRLAAPSAGIVEVLISW